MQSNKRESQILEVTDYRGLSVQLHIHTYMMQQSAVGAVQYSWTTQTYLLIWTRALLAVRSMGYECICMYRLTVNVCTERIRTRSCARKE